MLNHKHIDRVCIAAVALALILTCGLVLIFSGGGIRETQAQPAYERSLFDQDTVHEIDIRLADAEGFFASCENEEYVQCDIRIDGTLYKNAAIRAKGNTSLSQVRTYGNDRYSFKVEFDHYDHSLTCQGLDKLSLNNLIQDKTLMKDYLAYTLMNKMGVASPLCSYAAVHVNGEYFGLYLMAEGVEDAFLRRNWGAAQGDLYKPDSLSFGGGRGNGRDFDMDSFRKTWEERQNQEEAQNDGAGQKDSAPRHPDGSSFRQPDQAEGSRTEQPSPSGRQMPGNFSMDGKQMMGFGGMGAQDVKLQYIDDNADSYQNIFDSAKTTVTQEDQQRLIASLKALSQGDESVIDRQQVLMYFAVHNFMVNDDSYTGQMIHNYYLYEQHGVLSMIPWDYNLALGGFSMGRGASDTINRSIDYSLSDRPMAAWIFDDAQSLADYHAAYQQFYHACLASGWLADEIDRVSALIDPYVQQDPTAFFDYETVTQAWDMLQQFMEARSQSVQRQLSGDATPVDDSQIDLSALGEFGMGGGGSFEMPGGMQMPEGFDPAQMGISPGSFDLPEGFDPSQMGTPPNGMQMPEGFDPSQMGTPSNGMQMPEGFDPSQMGMPPTGQRPE